MKIRKKDSLYYARDFLEIFFGEQDFSFDLVEQIAWCFIRFEEMRKKANRKEEETKKDEDDENKKNIF